MSVAKVLGSRLSTASRGPDADQIVASSIIVNATRKRVGPNQLDFEGETPDMDARGLPT